MNPEELLESYAEAIAKYERQMRIAKTSKSSSKRNDAAFAADEAYRTATDLKMILQGLGITVRRSLS
jgi:hypothetical protein